MTIKSCFVALLLIISTVFPAIAMQATTSSIQRQVLSEKEKQSRLANFMNVCRQANIECNEEEIKNGTLDLSSKLQNTPPPLLRDLWTKLSQLSWLETLYLKANQLTTIPAEVGNLKNLTTLSLWDNQLKNLPTWIGTLSNLRSLNLGYNQLTSIPEGISPLINLTEMKLYNNQIKSVPPWISKLSQLTALDLSTNQLTSLPDEMNQLINLTELNLNNNQIKSVPTWISKLTQLTSLNLGTNELKTIPTWINKLINLTELSLDNNQLTTIPKEVGDLKKLRQLQLYNNQLTTIPANIGKLVNLASFDVDNNPLQTLPAEMGNLINLTRLYLNNIQLKSLPTWINKLINLTELFLDNNQLTTIPKEVGGLKKLRQLKLYNNQLTTIPANIGKLVNLASFDVDNNPLQTLPAEMGNLINLTHLYLNNIQLESLPTWISNLTNLRELHLKGNQLETLPSTIGNLQFLTILDLTSCPLLLPQGDPPTTWGRQELRQRFGDRVSFDDPKVTVMPADTTLEQVYAALDAQPLRIDREWLQKAALPDIKAPNLSGEEIVNLFNTIMRQLNTTAESKEGYVSYEVLMNDYSNDTQHAGMSNAQKINTYFMPRLRGFIKTLYGLPLGPNENTGWQMYEAQRPQMKQALSFILTTINTAPDIDIRAALMTQLANALLHCPTGQSEGLNTIVYNMLEAQVGEEELDERITRIIAIKKNNAFQNAILLKTANNPQNVHFISHYRDKLKSTLGLTTALSGFQEKIGTFGEDPFAGNPANVLSVFYQLVTPARMVEWVMSSVNTQDDLKIAQYKRELDKLTTAATKPNPAVATFANRIEVLHAKKKCLEDPKKILIDLKDEIMRIKKEERPKWRQNKIEAVNADIKRFEDLKSRMMPKPVVASPELIEYLKSQKLLSKDKEASREEFKKALPIVKGIIKENSQFRPLTTGAINDYLRNNKIVDENDPNWWQEYFTTDPDEIGAIASPKPKAIEAILIHMGALKVLDVNRGPE